MNTFTSPASRERSAQREQRIAAALHELRAPRRWILCLALIVLLAVTWTAYAPLSMIVRAEGRVMPSTRNQVVQHLEGGVVLSINVAEGDVVRQGDLLARVSDVQANSQMGERRVREEALRAKVARLSAEATGAGTLNTVGTGGTAVARAEHDAFVARRLRIEQDLRVAGEQIAQKRAELAELGSRRTHLLAELDLAQRQLQIAADMVQREAASKLEHLDAQAKVQRLRTMIADVDASSPRVRAAIAEIEGRAREIESRFRADARTELTAAQTDLQRVAEELKASSDRVERTELRAPVAGVVNRINVTTVGGVIRPGEAVVEITPADEKILVEAKVRPADRAELHPGQPVHVRLSAYDYASFGVAEGRLTEVSPDTMPDERGDRFYRIRVALDGERHPFAGRPIVPGMVATAEVVVGRRTVLAYLLSPLNRISRAALSEPL
ncbi:HlyD family type I secretion periplasmic adaptor subunit [Hydrogenophaga sp.]|uniref:HlyD family type I secretion periplasmic adaptor subunit n=1 Tax=Hydrogenophaga sp. TaxID=1904254 RepID=UPI0026217B81|nr:HlyD family type I secretion periplasmic adaptor subunit [Hydrogenophaga sp.]MCW5655259.1 HlyD family type I secretion periplasmic adaptor subunit [Hydrogenophaga sp.]